MLDLTNTWLLTGCKRVADVYETASSTCRVSASCTRSAGSASASSAKAAVAVSAGNAVSCRASTATSGIPYSAADSAATGATARSGSSSGSASSALTVTAGGTMLVPTPVPTAPAAPKPEPVPMPLPPLLHGFANAAGAADTNPRSKARPVVIAIVLCNIVYKTTITLLINDSMDYSNYYLYNLILR